MGTTPNILRQAGKSAFETDSLNSEAKIEEILSTISLKAKEGISFKGDFSDSHEIITFLSSTKSVGKKIKVFCNLMFFSTGYKDEGGIMLAGVLATDEK